MLRSLIKVSGVLRRLQMKVTLLMYSLTIITIYQLPGSGHLLGCVLGCN